MITIKGKYNSAECYTDDIEYTAREQIKAMTNDPTFEGCKIRIMPDVHAGVGCTIGTTMTIGEKVAPSMVGVDIGCGMYTVALGEVDIDLEAFDRAAHALPSGHGTRSEPVEPFDVSRLVCNKDIKRVAYAACSLGTLGGGNHFIELDKDEAGETYLVVHSGSRNLGAQVAEHYMDVAVDLALDKPSHMREREELVRTLKREKRDGQIQASLRKLDDNWNAKRNTVSRERSCVYGQALEDYLHDLDVCIDFARRNREIIAESLLTAVGLRPVEEFHTVHNYIDTEMGVLRKGAISARKGERILIPINMRDGALICIGKGNEDWNSSAPHGAGRLMSRANARRQLTLEEYRKEMRGIYTTSVGMNTIDESPMAYKSIHDILRNIRPTCTVVNRLKPIYNFKAGN